MSGSSIGTIFKLHTFGESHGAAIGGIIDGCPADFKLDFEKIQYELDRRKPGQSSITTDRKESDTVQFLSGIFEGKTTGTPIGFTIPNENQQSKDYGNLKDVFRPSHADYTYEKKYGIRDHRGGGRSSARETAVRVVAGAIAKQILEAKGIEVVSFVDQIYTHKMTDSANRIFTKKSIESSLVRCPDEEISQKMIAEIEQAKAEGDSLGGAISCHIYGLPAGLGEPVFDKFHAQMGKAFFSINAVKAVSFGEGFDSLEMKGSEHNDAFVGQSSQENMPNLDITKSNRSGGIQGGLTNGMPVIARIAFKPVASIKKSQQTINKFGEEVKLQIEGRHDPCVVPRAVPIVDAMAAIVALDFLLMQQTTHLI